MATVEAPAAPGDVAATKSQTFTGQRPDITPAQLVAVVGNVIAVAVAFGAHITKQQQDAILALVGVLGAFLIASDAHLRSRRALATAYREATAAHAAMVSAAIAANPAVATNVAPPAPPGR
jgi:ACR3 family arsenite efflux pump ArsB